MFDRVRRRIREAVRVRRYVMTLHAEEEMADEGLGVLDIENVLLTGRVVERQRDRTTRESKYLVLGEPLAGDRDVVVAVKFGPTGRLVILTVYVE